MPSHEPSAVCNPLMRMEIRFDGVDNVGGLRTVNGARFGMVRNGGTKPHQGVDLFALPGTKVFAVATGEIVRVRQHDVSYGKEIVLCFRPTTQIAAYCGLKSGDPLYVLYAHLSLTNVSLGPVKKGQIIGATGTSGNADQRYPHLHLEVRTLKDAGFGLKHRINPERIFSGIDYSKPVEAIARLSVTA